MRFSYIYRFLAAAASLLAPSLVFAERGFVTPAKMVVGKNLEVFATVRLTEPAPAAGLELTLTTDDATKLLLSRMPDDAGEKSITIKINGHYVETPDFFIQGLSDTGTATYSVTAPGYNTAKGTVTLAPSAIVITGPFKAPAFKTTPAMSTKILLTAAALDESGKFLEQQHIAGGMHVSVNVKSSETKVGVTVPSSIKLGAGEAFAAIEFKPAAVGQTTIAVDAPKGFRTPAEFANVTAHVELPGIGITGDIYIGKDLQVTSAVLLGEPAPEKGLDVTLTSSDPQRLVLSAKADEVGSKSVTIHVPAGKAQATYYIQGLSDSGEVTYSASAPGYRTRTAPIGLAPSGVMVVYSPYGPPDEAEVLRVAPPHEPRPFTASLSENKPKYLALWTVYLDPKTHRGADITAQPLRAGVAPIVELKTSNPAVGKVAQKVTLKSTMAYAATEFLPLSVGETEISVVTPNGFTTPANATSVTATVKD